jgi:xylulokinase
MLLAGLDVGTTHTKAGLYRVDGTPVVERRTVTPGDAEGLRATALRLLAACVREAGPPAAVGVAGMAETGVALGADGEPVGELLHWRDRRAVREAGELRSDEAAFFATTGLRPSAKLPLARWMWLRRNAPEVLRRMARWANAPDLVAAGLTGTVATSPTLAARTGAYDVRAAGYAPALLDLAGLRAGRMPPVGAPGRVTPAAAAGTGLVAGTPVVVAGHDHLVAAWAAGVRAPGQVADSMGTAEALIAPVRSMPPQSAWSTGISAGPYVDGRSYCLVGGLSDSGGLIDWLLGLTTDDPTSGRGLFTELVGPPERPPTGIVVLPYLRGRSAPEPDPGRTLSVHGVRPEHTLADLGRAVLEGLCMQVRWLLDTEMAVGGLRPEAVTVFGGPAANPTWMWIKARLTPAPLTVLPGRQYAAAGAAMLAAREIGVACEPVTGGEAVAAAAPEWEAVYRSRFLPLATEEQR